MQTIFADPTFTDYVEGGKCRVDISNLGELFDFIYVSLLPVLKVLYTVAALSSKAVAAVASH